MHRLAHRIVLSAGFVATLNCGATAQDWLDDFEDGSATDGTPVTWVPSPAFPADFEVIDADLVVTMADNGPPISSPRVNSYFATGASVRARMTAINGPGRFTVAFADQPTGIKGYVASFSTCDGGRIELFRGDRANVITYLGGGPLPWHYTPEEEFIVQLDVRDGVVSARVWRPGEPFPEPQIFDVDTNYPDGVPSIAIQDFGDHGDNGCGQPGDRSDATAIVRYAQASATPLTHASRADINADGVTDADDFFAYLDLFATDNDRADLTGDDIIDADDFFEYLDRFATD